MENPVTVEILLVVIGLAAPVFMGNFWWTVRSRAAMHKRINNLSVHVAEDYATNEALGDMERRLVDQLNRIEQKVDERNGRERP